MKKNIILILCATLFVACGGNKKTQTAASNTASNTAAKKTVIQTRYQSPVNTAILTSDLEVFKQNIDSVEGQGMLDLFLNYAAGICNPFRLREREEPVAAVCNKENNAEIIRLLIAKGAKWNTVHFVKKEGFSTYIARTIASDLKEWNPQAVKYTLSGLDKCLVALTQMQGTDDTKNNYYVYADFWRDNNCVITNYPSTYGRSSQEDKKLYYLIGASKEKIQELFGQEATVYEHPSEYREILTYKKAEETESKYTVSGKKGTATDYRVEEYHYVFTIDRGVVTKIQKLHASSTDGKGETKIIDQEQLKQNQKNLEETQKGKIANTRVRMIRR